ncbi:MAG: tetratricopeptide repeat protein [Desulfobacteraceae bacterium]|nr:tetratricopeptide repeat protein [Desulfobacteraceae bacterium]
MKTRNFRVFSLFFVFVGMLFIVFGPIAPTVGAKPDFRPDITIRISHLEEALKTIEEFSEQNAKSQWSPRSLIEGTLKGTQWLDTDRAMVFGLVLSEKSLDQKPKMAVLVPFTEPNPEFAAAYGAVEKQGYYLISLPPGQGGNIGEKLESALVQNAQDPKNRLLTVDIAAARALAKAKPEIEDMIRKARKGIEQQQSAAMEGPEEFEADQAEAMIRAFLKFFEQVKTFSAGLDLNRRDTAFFSEVLAAADTELEDLIARTIEEDAQSLLGKMEFSDKLGMQFRSRPFDISATTAFTEKYFGEMYKTMGVDLQGAASVVAPFTGETAGAMAIAPAGLVIEAVSCIKADRDLSVNYLESEYIPWILKTGEGMTEMYRKQFPDKDIAPVFVKTEKTTVSDIPVVGVKGHLPIVQDSGDDIKIFEMPLRMAVKDRYLLVTSNDGRMADLIAQVADLEPAPASGDLMEMTMDWGALIGAMSAMAPEQIQPSHKEIPETGTLNYTLDLGEGKFRSRYAMKTEDIKQFMDFVATLDPVPAGPEQAPAPEPSSEIKQTEPSPEPDQSTSRSASEKSEQSSSKQSKTGHQRFSKDEPRYWTEKGGLYLAYGNIDAAVKHFEKAVALDPDNAGAHCNLALAYAENRKFEKALEAMDHALSLEPENGRYLHARGWIRVQNGQRQKGIADIEKAAEKGHPDAVRYLDRIAPRQTREGRQ